jgi:cell division protein FtsI/penicillin-binding protein 2
VSARRSHYLTAEQAERARRAWPIAAMAVVALVIGLIVGANSGPGAGSALAGRFVAAWTRHDYAAMYLDIDAASRAAVTPAEFAQAYDAALATATAKHVRVVGSPRELSEGSVAVGVRIQTRLFGTLNERFVLPISHGAGGAGIAWSRSLAFPGLAEGETLARETMLPSRAKLLARDGSVLATGAASESSPRTYPLGETGRPLVGTVGPAQGARVRSLEAAGVPASANVGISGLELALDARLRGSPGGRLFAVPAGGGPPSHVLASVQPRSAGALRTTISPAIERAVVSALGTHYGGAVVISPATGQILAVAGIGLDSLQPPGSTFKMVTVAGVLEAHTAQRESSFPYATSTTLDGVKLSNANGESCGGTLEAAFATSCNSVFAPLGVKLGAERLVQTAQGFGFNHPPGIEGAAESTLPHASEIHGELALGSTAIGQGRVQASALEMAIVAATIADGGRRPAPTFLAAPAAASTPAGARVISATVARTVRRLMIAVVRSGTGTAAAISGVVVAGKTGTAELKSQCPPGTPEPPPTAEGTSTTPTTSSTAQCVSNATEPSNTDAWFAAFAPATRPRIALAVLLVKDGAGGTTAAPVAREVLEAGLRATSHG